MLEIAPPLDRATIWEQQSYETYIEAGETFTRLRVEYIHGDVVVTPAPNIVHQRIARNLIVALDALARSFLAGEVLGAPLDVELEAGAVVVQPDVMFVLAQHAPAVVQEQRISGAPDLVVEILSPSTARIDRAVKLELYAHYRVSEYWIVNPIDETVEVYTLHEQGYLVGGVYAPGDTIDAGMFGKARISVDAIFGLQPPREEGTARAA